jgi:hypothetical protein
MNRMKDDMLNVVVNANENDMVIYTRTILLLLRVRR